VNHYADHPDADDFDRTPRRYTPARPEPIYHLAERFAGGLSQHSGPFTREEAERELRELMSDPPEDRDMSLCVVEVPGPLDHQWRDAEVVLTSEECI
jgi:hypothetical protein